MLTTIDNPYSPYTQYRDWLAWDIQAGYHTNAYLARIARVSDALSPEQYEQAIDDAIDDILELNITGKYIRAVPPSP